MPRKNIVYIQLFIELLDDDRWLYKCNERQQLLYIKILLFAGRTANKIPKTPKWLKQKGNYRSSCEVLRKDIAHLLQTFSKFRESPKCYYFQNFKKYIPYLKGVPKEILGNSQGVPKDALDKIILDYIRLKKIKKDSLSPDNYVKIEEDIKQLYARAKQDTELITNGLHWLSEQGYEWTLKTLLKKWPDFLSKKDTWGKLKEAKRRLEKL